MKGRKKRTASARTEKVHKKQRSPTEELVNAKVSEYARDLGLIGLGVMSLTRDRAEEIGEIVYKAAKGKTSGDLKKLDDMTEEGRERVFSLIKTQAKSAVKEMNLVTKDDLKNLESRLRKTESKINRA